MSGRRINFGKTTKWDYILLAVFVIAGLLGAVLALSSCQRQKTIKLGPSVERDSALIHVWVHDSNPELYYTTSYVASVINNRVFYGSNCPVVVVRPEVTGIRRGGINIYDSEKAPGTQFNNCQKPYAAITKDGQEAIINLCGQRIINWTHALDPDIYLVAHNLARVMGIRNATTVPASGGSVQLAFVKEREVEALRKRYCW